MDETHRAMKELGAVGVQCFTNDRGKAMDGEQYMPLYDAMAEYDRPIWVHPTRGPNFPDYLSEDVSQYDNLVDLRLAVRNQRIHGATRVCKTV